MGYVIFYVVKAPKQIQKKKGWIYMKAKVLAVALLVLVFFSLFSGSVMAQGGEENQVASTILVNGRELGQLVVRYAGQEEYLVDGSWVSVSFYGSTVSWSNEVQFQVGGSGWKNYNFHNFNFQPREFGFFSWIGNSDCGAYAVNVRWRDITDGKIHYATVVLPKVSAPQVVAADMAGGYFSTYSPDYILASLGDWGNAHQRLEILIPEESSCSNYVLLLNGQKVSDFYEPPVEPGNGQRLCHAPMYGLVGSAWVEGGEAWLEIRGGPFEVSFQSSDAIPGFLQLNLYSSQRESWCGGNLH